MERGICPGNWLCLIDLVNTQQCYAKCLQLIRRLEYIAQGDSYADLEQEEMMAFFISRSDNARICDAMTLLKQEEQFADKGSKKFSKITSEEQLLFGLERERNRYKDVVRVNKFSYYFRIQLNSEENDITDLQYFVLMMQMIPSIRNKMAVRLMKNTEEEWGESDFFRVSHFLRFIQRKYRCFFACYNGTLKSLRALQVNADGTQSSFLPMLEIDGQIYKRLSKTWELTYDDYEKISYKKLYTTIYPQNCQEDDFTISLFKIGLRMFFKGLSGRKYANDEKKKTLLDFLVELVKNVQGITALDMILFGALAGDRLQSGLDSAVAARCMGEIQMLSLALSQILENIVNHSERNRGVFTFRIQSNREYLGSHYPGYVYNMESGCLEILLADGNSIDGIVEHFLHSNKADVQLRNVSDSICLGQLFGDCSDEKMAAIWHAVRKERPEMCHGLISFANSVRKLKGAFWVRSAPMIESESFRDLYYCDYTGKDYEAAQLLFGSYIPGTQFSVVVNRSTEDTVIAADEEDWAFDFDKLVYATTCQDLAKVLNYEEKIVEMVIGAEEMSLISPPFKQAEKDSAALRWKEWFDGFAGKKGPLKNRVFKCDLSIFCKKLSETPAIGEPFCKGFLSSQFFVDPEKDANCCILFQNANAYLSRIFAATLRVAETQEIAEWDKTCVYFVLNQYKGGNLSYCTAVMQDLLSDYEKEDFRKIFPRIFPLPLFVNGQEGETWFEQEIIRQADTAISNRSKQGFKILDTHMRLGNKVHLDSFYEMSLFFENPNYAYFTAFLFLRTLLKEFPETFYDKKQILIYGYASYSRAIIWAILQILSQYKERLGIEKEQREGRFPDVEFVIYQNDLKLDSEEPQVQMYYSRETWQRQPHKIWEPEDTTLISVVPISSSLTTFDKMGKELNQETGKNFVAKLSYTAFWVRNRYEKDNVCKPTEEEESFWKSVDPDKKSIKSDFIKGEIRYLACVTSMWRDPLNCKKCFPEDPIFEYPLVETDPTSTVPTQQFYLQREQASIPQDWLRLEEENDERIANLKGNMLYGHISKGDSHCQYFIKNQVYFQQEKEKVASWLKELRRKAIEDAYPAVAASRCINVLIIPQKADNVEFGQYVYEYYFQGCAECVIVNAEKEFRSNFRAAYSGLFSRLGTAVMDGKDIRFHYVDTSLQGGNSFSRAVSLVSACVEDWFYKDGTRYEFRIEQMFLLISRLSQSSKKMYVRNPDREFHAYAQLAISSMRTFGDSCVPCKLQEEARRYYRKAATKSISSYWEEKVYHRACVPFDQVEIDENQDLAAHEEGYRRMICAHRAAHYIRPIQGASVLDYFLALRGFFDEICNVNRDEKKAYGIYREVTDQNRKDWLAAGLKVIARPFFAYDYKTRCAVMDMYLLLAEHWVGESGIDELHKRLKKDQKSQKDYLLLKGNLEWIEGFANHLVRAIGEDECEKLAFIRNNILKSLADIKSNYVLRKDTILRITKKISHACQESGKSARAVEFYQHYLRSILRMTHSSSDETKSLWLEYLLQFGEDYNKKRLQELSNRKGDGIRRIVKEVPKDIQEIFRNFLEVLLVENNRPIYQLVVELHKKTLGDEKRDADAHGSGNGEEVIPEAEEAFLEDYLIRKSSKFLQFGKQNNMSYDQVHALHQLLILLDQTSHKIDDRYTDLGRALQGILNADADPKGSVVLFGESREKEEKDRRESSPVTRYLDLPDYFELYPQHIGERDGGRKEEEQAIFLHSWKTVKENEEAARFLLENGYYLLQQNDSEERVNIIIKLENNYAALMKPENRVKKIEIQKIEPIYIFIPCSMCRQQALGLMRKILMFRRKLIEWLEMDFNNNAIAILSRQRYLAKVLSTDKMGDHAENDFVECQEKLLLATDQREFEEEKRLGNWENTVSEEGMTENAYEVPDNAQPPLFGKLVAAREWFFLRSYVNSRISRLFRTMVRTDNEFEGEGLIDVERYYAYDSQSVMRRPARDLYTVFFTPIKIGFIRKKYLRQMMDVITFTIEGVPDYQIDGEEKPNASVEERLQNVAHQLKDFCCISLYFEKRNKQCAYLAEYLTVILLDCFVSGLKAGAVWNQVEWGGEAFEVLQGKKASEKCEIRVDRERGGKCGDKKYDNIVIRNEVYPHLRTEKKGFGMSQAAIRWYIDSLWRECICGKEEYPQVETTKRDGQYTIKLPILEVGEKNNE